MKRSLFLVLLFCGVAHAAGTISPAAPVVLEGGTQTFTCTANCGTGGAWTCSGCAGSINSSTGVYTAPSSVTNQQSCGGMQCLPNNYIYNVRADSMSVNSNSASWIAGAGTVPVNYLPSFPVNYCNGSTPTQSQVFFYTMLNNGTFRIPAYPFVKIEGGWANGHGITGVNGGAPYNPFNVDHHLICVNTDNNTLQEMYQTYPVGTGTGEGCSTCTSQSGLIYGSNSYTLPANGTTDAAGMELWPLTLRLQEVENAVATSGTINHALRFTLANGYISSTGSTDFLWPATTGTNQGGVVPYGARARLKASYNVSGFTYPGCTGTCLAVAKILLTQLQQYGIILADGGAGWQVQAEYTAWPYAYAMGMNAVSNTNIAISNFEFVDESGLKLSSTSGEANTGRETVTYTSSTGTATVEVVLQGVAVTLPNDSVYIAAGASAQTFTGLVNTGSLTWSMSPTVGTLTSGGLYTPPSSETEPTVTTVTATSTTDGTVSAQMRVVIEPFPSSAIRVVPGQTMDYTDSLSHVWYAGPTGNGDAAGSSSGSAFGYSNGGSWSGTDITIYEIPIYAGGDLRFDFYVPNGTYTVTAKLANNSTSDQGNFLLETQGVPLTSPTDVFGAVGANMPLDISSTATVTTGLLSFVLRNVNTQGNNVAPFISGLQITETSASTAFLSNATMSNAVIQ